MLYSTMLLVAGLAASMEVSHEPVAYVLDYGDMQNISLKATDVLVFSYDIPQVTSVQNPGVTYAKRSMAEMMAANVPDLPPDSQPTLPNDRRGKRKGLDHTPPFTGTVTGTVSIIKSAANQRIILVSDIQGDGIMQVLVRGKTAVSPTGVDAKPVMNTPMVVVRNSKVPTQVKFKGATAKSLAAVDSNVRTCLESHYKGAVPGNLRIVAESVAVK
ncbi:MAG: hypothetical protein L3K26_00875 [Candidatus Hydrogenedentes bacterium]|nr:hypothetical protein [Candidatus Hydrogenedentota bacterium]